MENFGVGLFHLSYYVSQLKILFQAMFFLTYHALTTIFLRVMLTNAFRTLVNNPF